MKAVSEAGLAIFFCSEIKSVRLVDALSRIWMVALHSASGSGSLENEKEPVSNWGKAFKEAIYETPGDTGATPDAQALSGAATISEVVLVILLEFIEMGNIALTELVSGIWVEALDSAIGNKTMKRIMAGFEVAIKEGSRGRQRHGKGLFLCYWKNKNGGSGYQR